MMLRRQRGGGSSLPISGGGGNNSSSGTSYYNNTGSNQKSYGGYSKAPSSTPKSSSRTSSNRNNQQQSTQLLILRIGIAISTLWSIVVGGRYWSFSSALKDLMVHIPEANPMTADIRSRLPSVVEDYMKRLDSDIRSKERTIQQRQREQRRKLQQQLNDLERSNRFLQKESDELRVKHEGPDKEEEEARLQLREEGYQDQVALLQKATRKESKRVVMERFGMGPHFVKFAFEIQERNDIVNSEFVVQLAPLDVVPHAIHLFLEQVSHGLWNQSASFYINGPHILQAGPNLEEIEDDDDGENEAGREGTATASDKTTTTKTKANKEAEHKNPLRHKFEKMGLDSLAFPDYSDEFPHVPWTIGYAGRPGGPDFYINKADNTKPHGPGGQSQHALEEEGDSCFGTVVKGKEALLRVFASRTYMDGTEWNHVMKEPASILGATILEVEDPVAFLSEDASAAANDNKNTKEGFSQNNADDMVNKINEKRKRRPRLPKIEHAVEP